MKTLYKIFTITILIWLPRFVDAQTLKTSVYSGAKPRAISGVSIGVQLPGFIGDIEVGGFYETHSKFTTDSNGEESREVIGAQGILASFSVASTRKLNVNFGTKIGLIRDGVFIHPSLTAEYYLSDIVSVGVESRLANMTPAFQAKLSFYMFGAQDRKFRQAKYKARKESYRVHKQYRD
ncbi:hypothetical protein SAMN04488029_2655 [Reichenbachiella faecimaris]|uniref:Outer membrane protein beta-barrel domain-containing protein n=1 Tax=Reichenbachiella faecimaris TaxID=692418 RepID=A0A1W2GH90_REIFA|nr:hypothetical protein [Reichenbachiella faecimaris]SMD36007.1 hypothetical protein SAMN04488029_2655 [Reichenbachiella faecimaris]